MLHVEQPVDSQSAAAAAPPDPAQAAELEAKLGRLRAVIAGYGPSLVAFSGGVDSALVLAVAAEALGASVVSLTAVSETMAAREITAAAELAASLGVRHEQVRANELSRPGFAENPSNRCYHCKSELFGVLLRLRDELGFSAVAYGVNADDTGDFRPGHRAARERGVLSPLLDAGLGKAEIRALSREAGLPTADLPASACLSSRLPYGTEVTPERLRQVDRAEALLRAMGFRQVRVRHHGDVARIEVDPDELPFAFDPPTARAISAALRSIGFRWVCLDLEGYRTGSLNEALPPGARG